MLLDEFNNLVQSIVDVNEYPLRENPYIFNMSMNLQVNEIYTDKHLNMFLPEFLEALCRVIDKFSPYPLSESREDWPMDRRQSQPLVNKLENILPLLMKLITHPDYKVLRDKFPTPPKDISTDLYNPNYDSPFYQGYIIKTNVKKDNDLEIHIDENDEDGKNEGNEGENEGKEGENKKDDNNGEKQENQNNEEKKDEAKKEGEIGSDNNENNNNQGQAETDNINNDNSNEEKNNENDNTNLNQEINKNEDNSKNEENHNEVENENVQETEN
jgi:hypothetical protein